MTSQSQLFKKSVSAIEKKGVLLVYPHQNRPEPPSLWKELFPRSKMDWAWDGDADSRVAKLWILREELSRSGEVIYSKWYSGRATFFSKKDFVDLLAIRKPWVIDQNLKGEALEIYQALEESSPQSTKEIKKAVGLQGKFFESTYSRAMKKLFEAGLIVGWGEVNEGAFPSLACGATKVLFEPEWLFAQDVSYDEALARVESRWNQKFKSFLFKLT